MDHIKERIGKAMAVPERVQEKLGPQTFCFILDVQDHCETDTGQWNSNMVKTKSVNKKLTKVKG